MEANRSNSKGPVGVNLGAPTAAAEQRDEVAAPHDGHRLPSHTDARLCQPATAVAKSVCRISSLPMEGSARVVALARERADVRGGFQTRTSSLGAARPLPPSADIARAVRWFQAALHRPRAGAPCWASPNWGIRRGGNSHPYPEQFRFARRICRSPCGRLGVRETDFRGGSPHARHRSARVHGAARWGGGCVAAGGACAAAGADAAHWRAHELGR